MSAPPNNDNANDDEDDVIYCGTTATTIAAATTATIATSAATSASTTATTTTTTDGGTRLPSASSTSSVHHPDKIPPRPSLWRALLLCHESMPTDFHDPTLFRRIQEAVAATTPANGAAKACHEEVLALGPLLDPRDTTEEPKNEKNSEAHGVASTTTTTNATTTTTTNETLTTTAHPVVPSLRPLLHLHRSTQWTLPPVSVHVAAHLDGANRACRRLPPPPPHSSIAPTTRPAHLPPQKRGSNDGGGHSDTTTTTNTNKAVAFHTTEAAIQSHNAKGRDAEWKRKRSLQQRDERQRRRRRIEAKNATTGANVAAAAVAGNAAAVAHDDPMPDPDKYPFDLVHDWSSLQLGTITGTPAWNAALREAAMQRGDPTVETIVPQLSPTEALDALRSLCTLRTIAPPEHSPLWTRMFRRPPTKRATAPRATDSLQPPDRMDDSDLYQSLTECHESLVAHDAFLPLEHYWSSTADDMRQRLRGLEHDVARLQGRETHVLDLARKVGLDDDVGGTVGASSYTRRTILQLRGLVGPDSEDEALFAPATTTMGSPDNAARILRKVQPRAHTDPYFRSQDRW